MGLAHQHIPVKVGHMLRLFPENAAAKQGQSVNLSNNRTPVAKKPANQRSGEASAGELSKDNTTVLADKRINGLVVMTDKKLVSVLENIIESMDIKLSQVLIETVIIEVSLGDNLKTGIDWVMGGAVAQNVFMNHGQMIGGGAGQEPHHQGVARGPRPLSPDGERNGETSGQDRRDRARPSDAGSPQWENGGDDAPFSVLRPQMQKANARASIGVRGS